MNSISSKTTSFVQKPATETDDPAEATFNQNDDVLVVDDELEAIMLYPLLVPEIEIAAAASLTTTTLKRHTPRKLVCRPSTMPRRT